MEPFTPSSPFLIISKLEVHIALLHPLRVLQLQSAREANWNQVNFLLHAVIIGSFLNSRSFNPAKAWWRNGSEHRPVLCIGGLFLCKTTWLWCTFYLQDRDGVTHRYTGIRKSPLETRGKLLSLILGCLLDIITSPERTWVRKTLQKMNHRTRFIVLDRGALITLTGALVQYNFDNMIMVLLLVHLCSPKLQTTSSYKRLQNEVVRMMVVRVEQVKEMCFLRGIVYSDGPSNLNWGISTVS